MQLLRLQKNKLTAMDKIEYLYGSRKMEAELTYSDRKTIDLRVFPEGNVVVTAPFDAQAATILEKIKSKSKWVVQQQRTFELYRPFAKERLYIPGETHRYLGRQYRLIVNKKAAGNTEINLGKGLFTITTKSDDVAEIVNAFYKRKANEVFNKVLENLLGTFPSFANFNIVLKHRFMKKRWGSCTMDGNILLNTELIKANKTCIEYVILHELCHLIEPNHSKQFYDLLGTYLPDWQKTKHKLEITLA